MKDTGKNTNIGKRLATWMKQAMGSVRIGRIDWYIMKKFLSTYVFLIAIVILIAIIFDYNEKIDKFTQSHVPVRKIVFDYYLNFIPYFSNLFSPLFVFIAVILFTSNLASNSEIIAMKAAGMSFRRLLRPYMLSAFLIAVVTFFSGSLRHSCRQHFEGEFRECLRQEKKHHHGR